MLGTQAAELPYEWKGSFDTPLDSYTWGAQKTGTSPICKAYVDPGMKFVAIPIADSKLESLTAATSKGTTAMEGSCEDVVSGGTIVPSDTKCYKLIFDENSGDSKYTLDTAGVAAVAFFTEHVPTEFEDTEHYLKDDAGTDIEPVEQDPDPSAGGGHSHGAWKDKYDGNCQCQAKKNGWKIDCTDKTTMMTSEQYLKDNTECKTCPSSAKCKKEYLLVQAHHDHCLHNQLPEDMEKLMHDYEHYYDDCIIPRQYNPSLGDCTPVKDSEGRCKDKQAMTDAIAKLDADCGTSCADAACVSTIQLVLMAHDTCPEEDLPEAIEYSLHDHEVVCENYLCNSATEMIDVEKIACSKEEEAHAGHDHDHDDHADDTKAPTAVPPPPPTAVPTEVVDTVVSAASGFGSHGFLMTMSAMWLGFSAM
jgi:hypothetical protein